MSSEDENEDENEDEYEAKLIPDAQRSTCHILTIINTYVRS